VDPAAGERELIRKLVFTGHITVSERKPLPNRKARGGLISSVIEDALKSGDWFWVWRLPDDSMAGCEVSYRGDGPTRVCWRYRGVEGEREGVWEYDSHHQAVAAILREAQECWGNGIDGVPIDWDA
jgi:hypothetical protein